MTPFSIREYVRWGDVDAAGVICYGAYVRFIEIAETELFRAAGIPYGKVFERFDCWLPRASYKMEFRKPAVLDEQLTVNARVGRIGTSSIALEFAFREGHRLTMVKLTVWAALSKAPSDAW